MRLNFIYILIFAFSIVIAGCGSSEKSQSKEVRNLQLGDPGKDYLSGSRKTDAAFHEGMKQKVIGNYEKAIEKFEKAIDQNSELAAGYFQIADIYEEQKKYDEAIYYAEKAAELEPDNKFYQLLHSKVLTYFQKYDDAANILEKLLEKEPRNRELHIRLAMLYDQKGDYKKAIETYDRFEEVAGVHEQIILAKKSLYLRLDDIKSAVAEMEKLIEANPDEMRYYNMLADVYRANNMSDKALKIYERMLEREEDNPEAAFSLAGYYLDKENEEKFKQYIEPAFKSRQIDLNRKTQFLVNFIRRNPEKEKYALQLSDWMLEAHGSSAEAFATKAQILKMQDKNKEALGMFEKALEIDEGNFNIWQDAMLLAANLQEYERLEKLASDAVIVYPNQPFPYFMRGLAYSMQGKNDKAKSAYEQALLMSTGNKALEAEIYGNLGDLYHKLGKHELSDSCYDESLDRNPDNPYVLNNFAYYLSLRNEKLEKAEKMARKANQLEPGNSSFEDTYGWVLYQMGNYKSAEEWILRAINHSGSNSGTVLEHYGDVQYKLENKEKALEYWNKAMNAGGGSDKLEKKIAEEKLYE